MSQAPLRRVPLPTVLMHWTLVLALGVGLATGLRIAADAPDAAVTRALGPWLPQGDVLLWHLGAGLVVVALLVGYSLYQVRAGLGRRFLPARGTLRGWPGVNLALYWIGFGLLGLAVVTGLVQYLGLRPGPRALVETLHRVAAFGLLAYAVLHVVGQLGQGGPRRLVGISVPRLAFGWTGGLAGLVAVAVAAGLASADRAVQGTLDIPRVSAAPVLDGVPDDPAWSQARPVQVALANGANLPGGETRVSVRAVHDGERVYVLCEWDDPTRSQKHVPLVKTAEGWRIQQTAYRQADESVFYEDKLALMLAPANPLAALGAIHLGTAPLTGQPGAPGGRGLHYTTDGGILDVWHWKSVRNGAHNQADDNFFGPALPAPQETPRVKDPGTGAWFPRYMAGYRADPPGTFTGYEMNWEFFDEDLSLPLRLPNDPRDLAALGQVDLAPESSDAGPWWIELNDTHPYSDKPDELPVGTVLPSVLATSRLTGDRGDIGARGTWVDGRWRLELRRRLDTGSPRDVAVAEGTLLWVAVFDHAQTRHAYHLRPVRIRLR